MPTVRLQGVTIRIRYSRAGQIFDFPILLTNQQDLRVLAAAYTLPPLLAFVLRYYIIRPLARHRRLHKVVPQFKRCNTASQLVGFSVSSVNCCTAPELWCWTFLYMLIVVGTCAGYNSFYLFRLVPQWPILTAEVCWIVTVQTKAARREGAKAVKEGLAAAAAAAELLRPVARRKMQAELLQVHLPLPTIAYRIAISSA